MSPDEAQNILRMIYGNAYVTGQHAAIAQMGGGANVTSDLVSADAAIALAKGAAALLKADCAVSVTGVAGPEPQDGEDVGTVFVGIVIPGKAPFAERLQLPGDRARIRQYSAISALDLLRRAFD
jgi:PncC family amidohydrolase